MNNPIRFIDLDGMYSTEEWKQDNGITDDNVITVYSSKNEPDQKETDDSTDNDDPDWASKKGAEVHQQANYFGVEGVLHIIE